MKLKPIKVLGILLFCSLLTSATCTKDDEPTGGGKDCPNITPITVIVHPTFRVTKAFLDDPDSDIEGVSLTYNVYKTYCEGNVKGNYTTTFVSGSGGYANPNWDATYNLDSEDDMVTIHVYGGGNGPGGTHRVNETIFLKYNTLKAYDKQTFDKQYTLECAWPL